MTSIFIPGNHVITLPQFLLLPLLLVSLLAGNARGQAVYKEEDTKFYSSIVQYARTQNLQDRPIEEIVYEVGKQFIGTPYVAHTLETTSNEAFVVNLKQVDCTTFVEYCLAIGRCVKTNNVSFDNFCNQLEMIRYRGGKKIDYASRLHYMTDWLHEHEDAGIVKNVSKECKGVEITKDIHYMTTHRDKYSQLSDSNQYEQILETEDRISALPYFYIPRENVNQVDCIRNGDIIAITTSIASLDVVHVGLAMVQKDSVYLLNASSINKKVEISNTSLYTYLKKKSFMTGVVVIRPL